MKALTIGWYPATTKSLSQFGAGIPDLPDGTEGSFALTGFNSFGSPWGTFIADSGFRFACSLYSLEVDFASDLVNRVHYFPHCDEGGEAE